MIIIACVDDHFGMQFNRRRQSQDRILRDRIVALTADGRLWMNPYSGKQFKEMEAPHIIVDEDYLNNAAPGDYCFVEGSPVLPYENMAEQIILYKWNRSYPADFYFDIPLPEHGWNLIRSMDFAGNSHEKITEEVYGREEK